MNRLAVVLALFALGVAPACALLGGGRDDLEVVFEGNDELSGRKLTDAIEPVLEDFAESRFQRSAVDDAAFEIERAYHAAGFPFVRVEYDFEEREGGKPFARFSIDEGPRTELVELVFAGNEAYGARTLAPFFEEPQGGLVGTRRTYYDRGRVQSGADDVERWYSTRGYLDARVLEPAVRFDETRTRATVTIRVEEGLRYELAEVAILPSGGTDETEPAEPAPAPGVPALETAESVARAPTAVERALERAFEPFVGRPFTERVVLEIAGRIEDHYANRGRPSVAVALAGRTVTSEGRVRLTYRVEPGPRVRIGEVRIEGALETRESFLRSRLRLERGDTYDRSKERESFRRLYQTGLFERVEIRLGERLETSGDAAGRGGEGGRGGVAEAREAAGEGEPTAPGAEPASAAEPADPAQDARSGEPAATAPPATALESADEDAEPTEIERVLEVELDEIDSLELFVQPGWGSYERLRATVGVRERNLLGTGRILRAEGSVSGLAQSGRVGLTDPWFLGSEVVADLTLFGNRRQQPSFRRLELGSGIEFGRQFSRTFRAAVGYQFRRSDVSDVEVVDAEVEEALGDVDISAILLSPTYDDRNNPFAPSEGSLAKAVFEFADHEIGSQLEFVRAQQTLATFRALDEDTVLGAGARFGVIVPFGTTETIPLQERFFNGGESTVRSFGEDELGPKDASGTPLGGEAFSVISLEVRRRVWGRFELALFYDLGNVVPQVGDFLDFRGYREGIGLGLRYATPVGPIRLDGAVNPDPDGDEARGAIHFSIGMAF